MKQYKVGQKISYRYFDDNGDAMVGNGEISSVIPLGLFGSSFVVGTKYMMKETNREVFDYQIMDDDEIESL